MKYVGGGTFTTQQFSTDETITEIDDVIGIAKAVIKSNLSNVSGDTGKHLKYAINRLDEAEHYLGFVRKKVKKAIAYVPEDIQTKEYL